MRLTVAVHRPARKQPLSLQRYLDALLAPLRALDVSLVPYEDGDAWPGAADLAWDPFCGWSQGPVWPKGQAAGPRVITFHGAAALSLPATEVWGDALNALDHELIVQQRLAHWLEAVHSVDLAIVPSHHGRVEIRRYVGLPHRRATVVPHGVDRSIFYPQGDARSDVGLLHISAWQPKKNVGRLIEAYAGLPVASRPRLTLICPGANAEPVRAIPGVRLIAEAQTSTTLAEFYRGATAFVFPSLAETFGMPVAEAMACGCPVLTSQGSALSEYFTQSALLVDPRSVDDIRDGLSKLINDVALRERLVSQGSAKAAELSWKASAAGHRQAFRQLVQSPAETAQTTMVSKKSPSVKSKSTGILVVGMHRSGTSAVAGLLQHLGVDLGSDLIPPAADNPKGFFEHQEIVDFHERILHHFQSGWDDPSPLPGQWWLSADMEPWRSELRGLLGRIFFNSTLWAVKDPRICRILPLWLRIMAEMGVTPKVLMVTRPAQEVMASLQARNDIAPDKGALLWLRHYVEAEWHSRHEARSTHNYLALLRNWRVEISKVSKVLDVKWPRSPEDVAPGVDAFLDKSLRHQDRGKGLDDIDPGPFRSWVQRAECALEALPGEKANAEFDSMRAELEASDARAAVYLSEISAAREALRRTHEAVVAQSRETETQHERAEQLRQELEDSRRDLAAHRAALQSMLASRSWRITRPLRGGKDFARKMRTIVCARRKVALSSVAQADGQSEYVDSADSSAGVPRKHDLRWSDSLPCGWARFEARAISESGGVCATATGRLFVDHGQGFSAYPAIVFPIKAGGRINANVQLPGGILGLRYEVSATEGPVRLTDARLRKSLLLSGRKRLARHVAHWEQRRFPHVSVPAGARPGYRVAKAIAKNRWLVPSAVKSRLRGPLGRVLGGTGPYEEWIRRFATLSDLDRTRIRRRVNELVQRPTISILMPTYNTSAVLLERAIESVQRQLYPHWELCIADDASTRPHVSVILKRKQAEDTRIKVHFREQNGHISAASNSALELASGNYIALLDHDDELSEDALYWVAEEINAYPDAKILYSDEDKIDPDGRRDGPYFKPDFSYELFLGQNLITHLGVYKADLVKSIGGFRTGVEGAQDWDLALRVLEHCGAAHVRHIPRVLYHWRLHAGSTALSEDEKPYAFVAQRKVLEDHVARTQAGIDILDHPIAPTTFHRPRWHLPDPSPLVSIIVPTRNARPVLESCISSVLGHTGYQTYEVIIVDNGSDDDQTLQYLQSLKSNPRIRVLRDDRSFNYAALNNRAAREARGEVLVLLNNDTEIITPGWLTELVSHAIRPEVGAVGARLLYPDGSVQHAGVILGLGGGAAHSHRGSPRGSWGHGARLILTQAYSAVTAACLAVRRDLYLSLGGLNEADFAIAYNDVDFCLRLRAQGYVNVYTPFAELYHYESKTRGVDEHGEKRIRFAGELERLRDRWPQVIAADPYYNPNLTLDREDFSLAWPPRLPDFSTLQNPVNESEPEFKFAASEPDEFAREQVESEAKSLKGTTDEALANDAELRPTFWVDRPSVSSPIKLFAGAWQSLKPEYALRDDGDRLVLVREDARILGAVKVFGGIEGWRVLELGPLEGRQSYSLLRAGASEVVGIEGNTQAYLRLLAFKEALRLDRLRVQLGNFVPYLAECAQSYDLVVACGVLYHLASPLDTLAHIARVAPRIYLWTHYYDADVIRQDSGWEGRFGPIETWTWQGLSVCGARQRYTDRQKKGFCGGLEAASLWLDKGSLRAALKQLGYDIINEIDEPERPNGPAISFCAVQRDVQRSTE